MTKRERIEDLGKLSMMLKLISENDIFENCQSKHAYETWLKQNVKKTKMTQKACMIYIASYDFFTHI